MIGILLYSTVLSYVFMDQFTTYYDSYLCFFDSFLLAYSYMYPASYVVPNTAVTKMQNLILPGGMSRPVQSQECIITTKAITINAVVKRHEPISSPQRHNAVSFS